MKVKHVIIRCELSPTLRISRKLKCVEQVFNILDIDAINDILDYAKSLNLNSETDIDSLISFISNKFNIKFIFE